MNYQLSNAGCGHRWISFHAPTVRQASKITVYPRVKVKISIVPAIRKEQPSACAFFNTRHECQRRRLTCKPPGVQIERITVLQWQDRGPLCGVPGSPAGEQSRLFCILQLGTNSDLILKSAGCLVSLQVEGILLRNCDSVTCTSG
jgi:hypothetical protein